MRPWLIVTLLIASCSGPGERQAIRTDRPSKALETAKPSTVVAQVRTSAKRALGIASPETEPTSKARELNVFGLKAHRAGDYPRAIKMFQAAIEESPTYRLARYNMACSHSRQGETNEAWALLQPLLREDFPRHKRRIAEDKDLAPLRESRLATTIDEVVNSIDARWQAEVAQSLPTAIYTHVAHKGAGEEFRTRSTAWPGALHPETGRFLPLIDRKRQKSRFRYEDEKGLHALVNLDAMAVVFLSLRFGDFGVHDIAMEVWDLRTGQMVRSLFLEYGVVRLELGISGEALVFRVEGVGEGRWSSWWGLPLRGENSSTKKLSIDASTAQVASGSVFKDGPTGAYLRAEPSAEGYELLQLHNAGKEFHVHKNVLNVGDRKIPLGRGHGAGKHRSVVESPLGNNVAVVSISVTTDYEDVYRSIIDLVKVDTGEVTRLAAGPGKAVARFDSRGRLHWKLGEQHSEGVGHKAF